MVLEFQGCRFVKKQKTVKHQQQWWSPNNNNNNDSQISVWGFNTRHREKRQQGRGKARKGQARKRWSDLIASGRGRPPGIFSKAGSGTERGTGCQARLGWGLPPQSRDPTPWSDGLIYPARLFSGSISCRIVSFPPPFWFSLQWFSSGLFLCPCIFFLLKPGLLFFFFFFSFEAVVSNKSSFVFFKLFSYFKFPLPRPSVCISAFHLGHLILSISGTKTKEGIRQKLTKPGLFLGAERHGEGVNHICLSFQSFIVFKAD